MVNITKQWQNANILKIKKSEKVQTYRTKKQRERLTVVERFQQLSGKTESD